MAHKYHAVPTVVDGYRFASKREARYYQNLKLLEKAGAIQDIELQPAFALVVNGHPIGVYRADFRYVDCETGGVVTVDVKGFRTKEYRLKKRLVEALYPVQIVEM